MALWLDTAIDSKDLEKFKEPENKYYYVVQTYGLHENEFTLGLEHGVEYLSTLRILLGLIDEQKANELKKIVENTQNQEEVDQKWVEDSSDEIGGHRSQFLNTKDVRRLIEYLNHVNSNINVVSNGDFTPKDEIIEKLKVMNPYFIETKPVNNYEFANRISEINMLLEFFQLANFYNCDVLYD